jgi:hypothetical protein
VQTLSSQKIKGTSQMAMAERGSKSRAIQEFLSANPESMPQQIVDGLKSQGIEVSFGLARSVKYRKPKKRRAARTPISTVSGGKPVTGSELIRRYIAKHPAEGPKAIERGLLEEGVKVSMALIGRVKYAKPAKAGKRRTAIAFTVRAAARSTAAASMTIEQLLEVKKFADSLGGADQLRQALDTLEQLR